MAQFEFLLVDGVILSAAAFQAERRISPAHPSVYERSLNRLNCAGFRDDAPQEAGRFKLSHYGFRPFAQFMTEKQSEHSKTTNSKPIPHIPLPFKEVIADVLKVKPPEQKKKRKIT